MFCITKKPWNIPGPNSKLFLGGYYKIIIIFFGKFVNIKKAAIEINLRSV